MHIEIRVPQSYDAEEIFKRLRREFLKAEVSLKSVRLETVRSECKTLEGNMLIRGFVYPTTEEESAESHLIATKTLERNGFEVVLVRTKKESYF